MLAQLVVLHLVIDIADESVAVEIRERDWCNIVTCHLDESAAYSWRLQNFAVGEHVLRPSSDIPTPVKVSSSPPSYTHKSFGI
jgi:hypothetical protein